MPDSTTSSAPRQPGLRHVPAKLGWGHRGFRVENRKHAALALLFLLAIPFALDQAAFQIRMREHNPDLKGWLASAVRMFDQPHEPFYGQDGGFYLYPPFFLTLVRPLALIPTWAGAAVFETLKWVALVVGLQLAWRLSSRPGEDVPPVVALGSLLFTWRFIDNDFAVGNVNVLLLLGILGSCWLVHRGRRFWAGFVLALPICIKVTPALLLVYFAYRRWWGTVIGSAAGAVFCLLLWPALWLGWSENIRLLAEWYDMVVASFLHHGQTRAMQTNQALAGLIERLFTDRVAIKPDTRITLVELSQGVRTAIRVGCGLGALAVAAWVCRGRLDPRRDPPAFAAEVGIVLVLMLMFSGLTWKAHMVTLLLPYSVLLAWVADSRNGRNRARVTIITLLLVSVALASLTGDVLTPTGADYAEAIGMPLLGAVVAGLALIILRRELRRATIEEQDGYRFC